MNKTLVALVVGTLLMGGTAPAFAAPEASFSPMGKKLGRGVVNTSTGWVEFPKALYAVNEEWGPGVALTLGGLHGLEVVVVRTLAGVYEAATFPVPLPAEYVPVVLPASAFTWEGLYLRSPR